MKATASRHGAWNPSLGYGVIDVAAAVAAATGQEIAPRVQAGAWLSVQRLRARAAGLARPERALRRVQLAVHLRTSAPTVAPDWRVLSLEVRSGGRWRRIARTTTRFGGGVHWTVGLSPGRHLLRVVYRGRWDLHGAVRLKPITVF